MVGEIEGNQFLEALFGASGPRNKADGNGFTCLHVCAQRPLDSQDGLRLAKRLIEETRGEERSLKPKGCGFTGLKSCFVFELRLF